MKVGRLFAALAVTLVSASACSTGQAKPPAPKQPPGQPPPKAGATLWFDFDKVAPGGRSTSVGDTSGNGYQGEILVANGGAVRWVAGRGGRGRAARFPDECQTPRCAQPTAVLRVTRAQGLNPGDAPFSFGATVNVRQLTQGANVLQKGHFNDPVQWKLQVDKGVPSCVVKDGRRRVIVVAHIELETGQWYNLECQKGDGYVALRVNGRERKRKNVRLGPVSTDAPLHIGAKGAGAYNNDQFHGLLDNIFVRLRR